VRSCDRIESDLEEAFARILQADVDGEDTAESAE